MQAGILEAFDENAAELVRRSTRDYSEAMVNDDIRRAARAKNTVVVVVDEAHNMLTEGASPKQMAKSLKGILNDAVFSLILLGTEDLHSLFKASRELLSRSREIVDLGKLKIGDKEDCEYFFGFANLLEERMLEAKVIDHPIGLAATPLRCAQLYDMADGVIGTVCRIVTVACDRAFQRDRGYITWDDIAEGYRGWLAATQQKGFDPFGKKGPHPATVAALKDYQEAAE
jgi:hypothetical protein